MKKNYCLGGFAAINTGTIENSYSLVKLSAKGNVSGGFVGKNSGNVTNSFSHIEKAKVSGGFYGIDTGSILHSYFFHSLSENSKALKNLSDTTIGQRLEEIKNTDDVGNLGFDMENVWEYGQEAKPIRFLNHNWIYDVSQSEKYAARKENSILIKTAEELRELANKINAGETGASDAYVVLDADIDLEGKEWIPIGKERPRAFTGLFDGQGHTVTNFVIRDKEVTNKGFFGFLKGEVYNLTVDCRIKANQMAGGIAANCDEGIIGCCAAIVDITGNQSDFGGLVGTNGGRIFQSYAAGKIHPFAFPWLLGLIPMLAIVGVLVAVNLPDGTGGNKYAPVPYDPDAIANPDAEDDQPRTDGNFASFQFEQKINIDLTSGLCAFNFKNPGESNHNIVVQLQFTDEQAKTIMGSTGRTEEEQAALEAAEDYNPEINRTTIAESGSIRPGYMLENLRLISQPNGATIPPGTYNAVVYLIFYDIETNNRAMLDSQLPVVIEVE